jgi:hypothetical protein
LTAPGISSSKLGHPQFASNLLSERYSWLPQRLQMYVPFSQKAKYLPVKGASVALWTMTASSSAVSFRFWVWFCDIKLSDRLFVFAAEKLFAFAAFPLIGVV